MAWDARDWHRCIVYRGGQSIIAAAARGGLHQLRLRIAFTELDAKNFPLRPSASYQWPRQHALHTSCSSVHSPIKKCEEMKTLKRLIQQLKAIGMKYSDCGNAAGSPSGRPWLPFTVAGSTLGAWERVQLGRSLCTRDRPGVGPRLISDTRHK